jgi:hypothetical protein
MNYQFTLHFRLPNPEADPAEYLDALFEAGCDDAVPGIGRKGQLALEFEREAASPDAAFTSALRDVKKAIPGIEFVSAEPDLVNLADLADIVGMTRQGLRKYVALEVKSVTSPFPAAVVPGVDARYRLAEVAQWLDGWKIVHIKPEVYETALQAARINIESQVKRLSATYTLSNDKKLQGRTYRIVGTDKPRAGKLDRKSGSGEIHLTMKSSGGSSTKTTRVRA